MRKNLLMAAAALAALGACGKSESRAASAASLAPSATPAADPTPATAAAPEVAPASAEEGAAMIAALGLEAAAGGMVMNDCGEAVTPGLHALDMGGAVGRALLFVVAGGPETASCYGMTGMRFHLFRAAGGKVERLHSDFGHFGPMESRHQGVRDFAVGGPGFEFPVMEWNGKAFVAGRTIPDTEFPQSPN